MRRALLALSVFLALWGASPEPGRADNVSRGTATFEERAAAEKMSRSRYRDLEVASLVLILIVGGGAILWAVRRK